MCFSKALSQLQRMTRFAYVLFILFAHEARCQIVPRSEFANNGYSFVDTIFLGPTRDSDYIAIGFLTLPDTTGLGESLIVYKHSNSFEHYPNVLTCLYCVGRGANDSTYHGGYLTKNRTVVFVQQTFACIDSVFIDFSGIVPTYQKVIRRSYEGYEKKHSVDYPGNYLFISKNKGGVRVTTFGLPIDKNDPIVKELFYVKPIKWKKLP